MPREIRYGGQVHSFPDDATDEEIRTALEGAAAPATSRAQSFGDQALDVLTSAWGKVNPVEQFKGIAHAAAHPIQAAKGITAAQGNLALEAKEAFQRGDYATGIRKSFNYLLPILGPELDVAGERMASGEIGKGIGETIGIAGNIFAPKGLSLLRGKVPAPLPRFVNPNPTQAAAMTYLESQGVPVTAGAKTGSPFVRGVEHLTTYSPFGAKIAQRSEQATTEALRRTAGKLSEQAHPVPVVAEQVGGDIRTSLSAKVERLGKEAGQHYDTLRAIEADPAQTRSVPVGFEVTPTGRKPIMQDVPLPVDVRGIKTELRPIYRHMTQFWEPARRNTSAGYQAIKSIIDGPDHVPASIAEAGLAGMKELARDASGRNAGLAKFTVPRLQSAIEDAVRQADPQALAALRQGRAMVAQQYTTKGVLDRLRTEPVQAFGQMTYAKDAGIDLLRKVAKEAPGELPKIGRAYLDNLFSKATAEGGFSRAQSILQEWNNLGPETKKMLYKRPALIENLDKFFLGAKKLAENPNPSGSALIGWIPAQAAWLINEPISGSAYILGSGALAKLLYSPKGARLLTEGLRIPVGKTAAGASIAGQLLDLAGRDAQRLEPAPAY